MWQRVMLDDWLAKHHATCMWEKRLSPRLLVTCYRVNGRICIINTYDTGGWDIFTMLPDSNLVTDALSDAEKRLGLAS